MKRKILAMVFFVVCVCFGFSLKSNAMTRDQALNWAKAQIGVAYDVDGISGYQCSDFGTAYINYIITGNAYSGTYTTYMGYNYFGLTYPDGWQKITNTADFVPEPGDILCFGANSYNSCGHVAVALEGCTVSVMYGLGQNGIANSGNGEAVKKETLQYYGGWGNFQGVIRPKWDSSDTTAPTISNVRVTSRTKNGYTVQCHVSDNVGVNRVQFPTWTATNGQDDIQQDWEHSSKSSGTIASDGTVTYTVNKSDHNNETGIYYTHIYAYDAAGNYTCYELTGEYVGTPADFGTNFYAVILNTNDEWKPLTNDSDYYVRIRTETGVARQLWYFERQSDTSYKISSCENGAVLAVANASDFDGARMTTCSGGNTDNERFYFYKQESGYIIRPKHTSRVLDVEGDVSTDGTNIIIHTPHNEQNQIFSVYTGSSSQLSAPTLKATAGTISTNTAFTWSAVYGESQHTLRIYSGSSTSGSLYKSVVLGSNVMSYNIVLPAGTYTATVSAENYFSGKTSNAVTFTINPATYSVAYNANGGSGAPSSQTKIHGTNLTLSSTKPTRTGYTFKNWNTKADGSGTAYSAGGTYSANAAVTLYAQWEVDSVDLGTGFYAYIIHEPSWKMLTQEDDGNVALYTENVTANQVWQFTKLSDGSYKILSSKDGKSLDVAGGSSKSGINLQTYAFNDTNAQHWILTINSGSYRLQAKCTSCVIDLADGETKDGTNVQMSELNNSNSQKFQVYKLDEKSPTLTVSATNSLADTKFSWDTVYGALRHELKIYDSSGNLYETVSSISGNSTSVNLPAGTYSATVKMYNYFYSTTSSAVSFSVDSTNYTISYSPNGGTGEMSDTAMRYDTAAALAENAFTRKNYTFTGWNTKADGSGTNYADKASVKNLTDENGGVVALYAQWERTVSTETTVESYGAYSLFNVKINRGFAPSRVILAAYKDGSLVSVQTRDYSKETETFAVAAEYDTVKVMVWDGDALEPISEVETVTVN